MHLSRLTTAVAFATALSVPAFTAPAHAAATNYTVVVGFNPTSTVGAAGETVTINQNVPPNVTVVYVADWGVTRTATGPTSVAFTVPPSGTGRIVAAGPGTNAVYTIN